MPQEDPFTKFINEELGGKELTDFLDAPNAPTEAQKTQPIQSQQPIYKKGLFIEFYQDLSTLEISSIIYDGQHVDKIDAFKPKGKLISSNLFTEIADIGNLLEIIIEN